MEKLWYTVDAEGPWLRDLEGLLAVLCPFSTAAPAETLHSPCSQDSVGGSSVATLVISPLSVTPGPTETHILDVQTLDPWERELLFHTTQFVVHVIAAPRN